MQQDLTPLRNFGSLYTFEIVICYTTLPVDNFFIGQETPLGLHMAAEQSDLDKVKSLVERGADVNIKDDDGVCI